MVVAALSPAAFAGVKTEEKTLVQFGGLLGGLMNKFGGKAAKEGVVDTVAVVGDRKLTLNDATRPDRGPRGGEDLRPRREEEKT